VIVARITFLLNNLNMKCPHCLENFFEAWEESHLGYSGEDGNWSAQFVQCPSCEKAVIQIKSARGDVLYWRQIWPKGTARAPIPDEVDDADLAADYNEACNVLADSSKASAALSRRCLQHILRTKAGVSPADLNNEIDEVINSQKLPADLSDSLHNVRLIGNFAAHPMKGKTSGEIIDVEVGEAEWNLDVVEDLMDYYYVRPARTKAKKEALNPKLKEAGKPELKL
jgi:hypothetical protein